MSDAEYDYGWGIMDKWECCLTSRSVEQAKWWVGQVLKGPDYPTTQEKLTELRECMEDAESTKIYYIYKTARDELLRSQVMKEILL